MQALSLAERAELEPVQTVLHELHTELGAKLVPFAGFSMPLNYPAGILAEHRHTRHRASLFDVSHMHRLRVTGLNADAALEALCPANIIDLPPGVLRYTVMTNDDGGIVDDLMIRRCDQGFEIIANAATRDADLAWLHAHLDSQCQVQTHDEFALLALQGPSAAEVLAGLQPNIHDLSFMQAAAFELAGKFCLVARCGYTGEDGFEISVPVEHAETLARELLAHETVAPAGLGARDGLRLEAGLCLYDQDMDATTSPVEAGIGWSIPKSRRTGGERTGGFPGSVRILAELAEGPARRLTGLLPSGRAPLRQDTALLNTDGTTIGRVTSGGHSPILEQPIALGYVDSTQLANNGKLQASLRNRLIDVQTTSLPFVSHRYVRH